VLDGLSGGDDGSVLDPASNLVGLLDDFVDGRSATRSRLVALSIILGSDLKCPADRGSAGFPYFMSLVRFPYSTLLSNDGNGTLLAD
jgi:hypothetical protein